MIQLGVRVVPRASKPGIAGTRSGAILVRLRSPPVDGAANEELIALLSQTFGVPRRDVAIVSGQRSKLKRVAVENLDSRHFERVLDSFGIDSHDINVSS